MDNKRGVIIIFALLSTLVLSTFFGALYVNSMGEKQQSDRQINSMRAFWLAEAGLATVKANPGLNSASGTLGGTSYAYNVPTPQAIAGTGNVYWLVTSTGTVTLPNGSSISRTLEATIKTGTADATKFPHAVDTTTDLVIKGSVEINGTTQENDNTINFDNMFGISKATMQAGATHLYTDSNFTAPVDGITWVDVASGNELTISGTLSGSGILVVNGNVHISGTVNFDGIIYVVGTLTMTGTVTATGSIVAESSATADTTVKGNVTITHDTTQVAAALTNVQLLSKQLVAWQEQ